MKRFTIAVLFLLALGPVAVAQQALYQNFGTITAPTNIDAITFENLGLFDIAAATADVDDLPFATQSTLYFTNRGTMIGQPGFLFDTGTPSGRHPAVSFDNHGTIISLDTTVGGFLALGAGPIVVEPPLISGVAINSGLPSSTVVSADNITIDGNMVVGDDGLLQLTGGNVQLDFGALSVGTISELDTNATSSQGLLSEFIAGGKDFPVFVPPTDVYDIAWGLTNGVTMPIDATAFQFGDVPFLEVDGSRNGTLGLTFPMSGDNFTSSVFAYEVSPTNIYYNMVFASLPADTNISVEIRFTEGFPLNVADPNGTNAMVKYSASVRDVISGTIVTNSVTLLDSGAAEGPFLEATNALNQQDTRPTPFQISTALPPSSTAALLWEIGSPGNIPFDPAIIYTAGIYQSNVVRATNAFYAAQVGRDPEFANGLFPFTASIIGTVNDDMPDLTNEPSRVAINAQQLDVTGLRMRTGGVASINAGSLTGTPAGTDFGNFNTTLGNPTAAMTITNLFPATFHRVRGDLLAWSADWANTQTNDGAGNAITNIIHFHVLVVDQDLQATFQTSALNVALRGANVTVNDPLHIVNSALFQAGNLTFNSSVHLTDNAASLVSATVPGLKNLLIGPNGSLTADNFMDIGLPLTANPINPNGQKFTITSITNLGSISSVAVLCQAQTFANGGSVMAANNGSIKINSRTTLLGAGLGVANSLQADADINLSGVSIQVSNSTITAGNAGAGQLTIYATSQLADFLPNTPSTNVYSTNFWRVTDGFSLPVKPAFGDLFGTVIKTITTNHGQVARHVWAGRDLGPSVAGFSNNVVIGHLIMDRQQQNSTLRFSAAGPRNAMYVDYLELQDYSYSDYHNGLVIDPNFTIYFAAANVPPDKLQEAFTNLVWVPQFAGPNSSVVVPYVGGSNALMNSSLATSPNIDTDGDGLPNASDPFPLDNPTLGPVPPPLSVTRLEVISVTNGPTIQSLTIYTVGQGTITPDLGRVGVQVGRPVTLTAAAPAGWLFAGWAGSVINSSVPAISFVMPPSDAVLIANFVRDPFYALAGNYNGLFYITNGIGAANSGFVTFSLNNHRGFSGRAQIENNNFPFSSQFNPNGAAAVRATNHGVILAIQLQLDTTNLSDVANGTVSTPAWTAALVADRAPLWSALTPAPQAGAYTMILPGNSDPAASPGGDGYGVITVTPLGRLSVVGKLADGSSFSQSVPLSQAGQWPFYYSTPAGNESLLGWITFGTNQCGGTVNWSKNPGPGKYYPGGFATSTVLLGNSYVKPVNHTSGLTLANPDVVLGGGNLGQPLVNQVIYNGRVTYTAENGSLTLTINPLTGVFSGKFNAQGLGAGIPLSGVVLQGQDTARGFFLGGSQSGSVLLEGK